MKNLLNEMKTTGLIAKQKIKNNKLAKGCKISYLHNWICIIYPAHKHCSWIDGGDQFKIEKQKIMDIFPEASKSIHSDGRGKVAINLTFE